MDEEDSKVDATEDNNDAAAAAAAAVETCEGEAEKEAEEKEKAVVGVFARLAKLRRGRRPARQGDRSPSQFSGSRSRSRDRCDSNSSDEPGTNTESVEMTTPLMVAASKEVTKGLKGGGEGKKVKVVVKGDGNEQRSMDFDFDSLFDILNQDEAPTSLSAAASEVAKGTYNSPPAKNLKRD